MRNITLHCAVESVRCEDEMTHSEVQPEQLFYSENISNPARRFVR